MTKSISLKKLCLCLGSLMDSQIWIAWKDCDWGWVYEITIDASYHSPKPFGKLQSVGRAVYRYIPKTGDRVALSRFARPNEDLYINLHPYLLKEYNRRWYLLVPRRMMASCLTSALTG